MRVALNVLPLGLYFSGLLSGPFFGPALAAWSGDMDIFYRLSLVFSLGHAAGLVAGGYYYFHEKEHPGGRLACAAAVLATAGTTLALALLSTERIPDFLEMPGFLLYGFASGWPVALYCRWLSSPGTAKVRGLIMGGNIFLANLILFLIGQGLGREFLAPGIAVAACTLMFALGGLLIIILSTGSSFHLGEKPSSIKGSLPPLRLILIGCLAYFTGGLYYQTILPEYSSALPEITLIAPYLIGFILLGPWSDRRGRGNLALISLLAIGGGFSLWAASVQLQWLGGVAHLMIITGLLCMDLFYWTSLADSAPPGAGSLTVGLGLAISILAISLPLLIGSFVPKDIILLRTLSGSLGVLFVLLSLVSIRERNLDFAIRSGLESEAARGLSAPDSTKATDTPAVPPVSCSEPNNPGGSRLDRLMAFNLTSREQEIAYLLVKEYSSREIIDHLCISQNTLKYHIKNILRKTDTNNRQELREKILIL